MVMSIVYIWYVMLNVFDYDDGVVVYVVFIMEVGIVEGYGYVWCNLYDIDVFEIGDEVVVV